jgi:hypothetical protein
MGEIIFVVMTEGFGNVVILLKPAPAAAGTGC